MEDLMYQAKTQLNERYNPPVHTVSAALLTSTGKVITALNLDHFLGFACAEVATLTIAINQKEYNLSKIVAYRKNEAGEPEIANMCGRCRQIFHDYAPGINVMTTDGEKTIEEMLPNAFMRQRNKIQASLERIK